MKQTGRKRQNWTLLKLSSNTWAMAIEFHFFTFHKKPVTIPLPVILYSPKEVVRLHVFPL